MTTTISCAEISENAWDIGTVIGVLTGIALTQTLLQNQKEAIQDAINAAKRLSERNHKLALQVTE